MLAIDPRYALVLAHERSRRLRADRTARPLHRASRGHCPLAALLRRGRNRPNPGPLAHRAA